MKTGILALIALSMAAQHAEAREARQVGKLVMSRCQSNGSLFTQDNCSKERRLGSCSVLSNGRKISLSSQKLSLSAGIEAPFNFDKEESRHNLKLRGLITGSVILDSSGVSAKRVEIYKNLDRSGKFYIRYSCGDLRNAKSAQRVNADDEALKALPAILQFSPAEESPSSCEDSISI